MIIILVGMIRIIIWLLQLNNNAYTRSRQYCSSDASWMDRINDSRLWWMCHSHCRTTFPWRVGTITPLCSRHGRTCSDAWQILSTFCGCCGKLKWSRNVVVFTSLELPICCIFIQNNWYFRRWYCACWFDIVVNARFGRLILYWRSCNCKVFTTLQDWSRAGKVIW